MKLSNGREVKIGLGLVGIDQGKNLVSGAVVSMNELAQAVRLLGVPLLVPVATALEIGDAYEMSLFANGARAEIALLEEQVKALQSALEQARSQANARATESPALTIVPVPEPSTTANQVGQAPPPATSVLTQLPTTDPAPSNAT